MHDDHWMEPANVTVNRPPEERWCESCGEEIPYHNVSCVLLKTAHRNRKHKCHFCPKVLVVGDEMFSHVTAEHIEEIKKQGIKLP
jgi:hypothetical protein